VTVHSAGAAENTIIDCEDVNGDRGLVFEPHGSYPAETEATVIEGITIPESTSPSDDTCHSGP